ncbi:ketosteroid isomerase [Veronia pacifica]|uniref:Ketosteroid isomerase n=2 Tax=Veronia pacifica TaxID=1080227 RepID=A0A1C3ER93_9GAMM|nr:ketosteroid isomerase [Veronia pacifica]
MHHSANEKNIILINDYFATLASGDMKKFSSFFAKDVVWHQPGKNKFSGPKQGFGEIGAMVGGMMQDTKGTFVVKQTGQPMANGDLVSVHVTFTGSKSGTKVDMTGHDLFKIQNNKIVEVWLFSEDQSAEDSFWDHK